MDVHGFNITYEIVNVTAPVRKDACSVYKCSFLGKVPFTLFRFDMSYKLTLFFLFLFFFQKKNNALKESVLWPLDMSLSAFTKTISTY